MPSDGVATFNWPIAPFGYRHDGIASQSPLKAKPLRNPGDSIDKEIESLSDDKVLEALFASGFSLIALTEWIGYLTHSPLRPVLFSCVALVACVFGAWRVWQVRGRLRQLRLGRNGERCVGQLLERLPMAELRITGCESNGGGQLAAHPATAYPPRW
jgi:hypothetical protein